MIWALALMALIIYFFAIIFTQAVSDSLQSDVEWRPEAERYFHSLPEAAVSRDVASSSFENEGHGRLGVEIHAFSW